MPLFPYAPRTALALAALPLLAALGAASAAALEITPNPVQLRASGDEVVGRITLVGTAAGLPAGGVTLRGSVAPTDDTLLFVFEYVDPDSLGPLGAVGVARSSGTWSGLGWIPGANVDWSIYSSLFEGTAGIAGPLESGQTSDVFFLSSTSIAPGTTLDFQFSGWHGVPYGTGSATVVPEPASLTLLAGALALLSFAPRRRSAVAALLVASSAAFAVPTPARAGTIVPNPVNAVGAGSAVNARFLLTGTATGLPAGGIVLGGSLASTDEVLLFTLEYTAAPSVAFTQIAVDRLSDAPFTAIGWIPGDGVDWTAAVQPLPELAFFQSGALVTGAVTDVFFVAATGFTPGESFAFVSSAPRGGPGGSGNAQWVPEPGTLALVTGGLALLARARRR